MLAGDSIVLVMDIKSRPEKTYTALRKLCEAYHSILSGVDNGVQTFRQLTIVLTGQRPERFVFVDANLETPVKTTQISGLSLLASGKYSNFTNWDGTKKMDEADKLK